MISYAMFFGSSILYILEWTFKFNINANKKSDWFKMLNSNIQMQPKTSTITI